MVDFAYFECHFSPRHATRSTQASAWKILDGWLEMDCGYLVSGTVWSAMAFSSLLLKNRDCDSALYHGTESHQLCLHDAESGSHTTESSMARLGLIVAKLNLHASYFLTAQVVVALQSYLLVTASSSLLELFRPPAMDRHGIHWRPARICNNILPGGQDIHIPR